MSDAAGPENEAPPLGKPIYDNQVSDSDQPDRLTPDHDSGEHVVVTPQTAGSAGTAHTDTDREG